MRKSLIRPRNCCPLALLERPMKLVAEVTSAGLSVSALFEATGTPSS